MALGGVGIWKGRSPWSYCYRIDILISLISPSFTVDSVRNDKRLVLSFQNIADGILLLGRMLKLA